MHVIEIHSKSILDSFFKNEFFLFTIMVWNCPLNWKLGTWIIYVVVVSFLLFSCINLFHLRERKCRLTSLYLGWYNSINVLFYFWQKCDFYDLWETFALVFLLLHIVYEQIYYCFSFAVISLLFKENCKNAKWKSFQRYVGRKHNMK